MTGHKKQRGWRGLEEDGEIERVRPQHLPRVTTSPQGVLNTAVLAVHCSACLTSTHRAGPRHTAAEDTLKCKERESTVGCEVRCKPWLFARLLSQLFLFYSRSFFFPWLLFLSLLLCRIRATKREQQFSAKFSSLPETVCLEATKVFFFGQFLTTPLSTQWMARPTHFINT